MPTRSSHSGWLVAIFLTCFLKMWWLRAQDPISAAQAKPKAEYRRHAMTHEGDPVRGRNVFFSELAGCSQCHSADGAEIKVGPGLAAIGDKFGRRDLIDAILEPSAEIAIGYDTTLIVTEQGDDYHGIIKQVTADHLELIRPDATTVRIAHTDIGHRQAGTVSLMPDGLQHALTLEQFTGLIAYLAGLKQPASLDLAQAGMPDPIPFVARPIGLIPFHSEEMRFDRPSWFGFVPGSTHSFFVLEHHLGRIWVLEKAEEGDRKTVFLDLGERVTAGGSRGLLGMAVHPEFESNRKYYLALHIVEDGQPLNLVVERQVAAGGREDSGRPARRLIVIKAATNVHYGGGLQFGPDGYLYVGTGDTGPQEDPQGNGQNGGLFRAKLLRIDPDRCADGKPYTVPSDNPFLGNPEILPETWAYGFREPWRFSFDPVTGDLWVGDVGQNLYEEIDIVRPGENHGWNVYEGFAPFSNRYRRTDRSYVPPVFAYGRRYGVSVTGGHVFRADPRSSFYGVYIFGDYQSRRIWGLTQRDRQLTCIREIGLSPERITSFGIDSSGNHYIAGYEGTIFRLDFSQAEFK